MTGLWRPPAGARRGPSAGGGWAAAACALALVAVVPACSDDDGAGPPASTTTTLAAAPAAGVVEVALEGRPSAVALGPAGLWVTSDHDPELAPAGGALRLHDAATGAELAEVPWPSPPVAVAPVGDGVWAIGATGQVSLLAALDPSVPPRSQTLLTVDVGRALVDAVVHDGRLYVGEIERGLIHVLDAGSGAVLSEPIPVPSGVVRLAVAGGRLWASGLEQAITPIDLDTGQAGAPVPVGAGPIGMAAVGDQLWVADSDDGTVTRLDARTGIALADPVPVGAAPIALVVDGEVVWVLNQDDPSVQALDAASGEPLGGPVALLMRPRGMVLAPAGLWIVGVDPSRAVLLPRSRDA